MMPLAPNQRVVCVRRPIPSAHIPNQPDVDEVYTVRGVFWDGVAQTDGIYLQGITNPIVEWGDGLTIEGGFRADCFRPLDPRIATANAHDARRRSVKAQ
jgi:hypothetical protein